jgi:hypothetical protein
MHQFGANGKVTLGLNGVVTADERDKQELSHMDDN